MNGDWQNRLNEDHGRPRAHPPAEGGCPRGRAGSHGMTRAGQRRDRRLPHGRGRDGTPARCSFCWPRRGRGPRGPRRPRAPGRRAAAGAGSACFALQRRWPWWWRRGWPSGRRWPGRSRCLVICAGPGCRPSSCSSRRPWLLSPGCTGGCSQLAVPVSASRRCWPPSMRPTGVGVGSAGRAGAGHGLHLPPLHPAGRRGPAGWLVAAGRRDGLHGRRGSGHGRRRAGVGERPGRGGAGVRAGDAIVVRGGWDYAASRHLRLPGMTLDAVAWIHARRDASPG